MPTHLKALLVILALAATVFWFAKATVYSGDSSNEEFERRRNLWFAVTLTAFLAHNFWIYIIVTVALVLFALPREPNKLALYFFMLLVVPPFGQEVTGLGLINHFFAIDYLRLLALTILLPTFWSLRKQPDVVPFGITYPDKIVTGYLILNFGLLLAAATFTDALRRGVFYSFIDIFLPFYVASRSVRSVRDFRRALMAFFVAAIVMGVIGVFETTRHWLLYAALQDTLAVQWGYSGYLEREGVGLRAQGSTGQPIVLGYVMAAAFGFYFYLRKSFPNNSFWRFGVLALVAGLIAPFSRGPWIGAGLMMLVFMATGSARKKTIAQASLVGVFSIVFLLSSPFGEKMTDLMSFGGVEGGEAAYNVQYRQQLLRTGINAVLENPFFGAYEVFLAEGADSLKQGNGMIDLVNTYLAVALGKGLIGFALFLGFFIAVAGGIVKAMINLTDKSSEPYLLGRVLFSTLIGLLVIIFTTSSILVISVITWSVAGLGVAYARMITLTNVSSGSSALPIMR
jgi:O-antigen ligase